MGVGLFFYYNNGQALRRSKDSETRAGHSANTNLLYLPFYEQIQTIIHYKNIVSVPFKQHDDGHDGL